MKSKKANETNWFIHFLGESAARQSAFNFIWPLITYQYSSLWVELVKIACADLLVDPKRPTGFENNLNGITFDHHFYVKTIDQWAFIMHNSFSKYSWCDLGISSLNDDLNKFYEHTMWCKNSYEISWYRNAERDQIFVLYCFVVDCKFSGDFKKIVRQLLNHFCWIDSGWARLYPCCDFFWFCSIFLFSQGLQWSIWMNFVQKITLANLMKFSSNYF